MACGSAAEEGREAADTAVMIPAAQALIFRKLVQGSQGDPRESAAIWAHSRPRGRLGRMVGRSRGTAIRSWLSRLSDQARSDLAASRKSSASQATGWQDCCGCGLTRQRQWQR